MKIGVVIHGPNIIDSGYAIKIIDYLKKKAIVDCKLGGTMGRTAVIDANLEKIIDISQKLLPSQSLKLFNNENVDIILLINYGKSSTTGHVFGYKVFNHYINNTKKNLIPIIQIERPGEKDASFIFWNNYIDTKKKSMILIKDMINDFKLKEISPKEIEDKYFSDESDDIDKRTIYGVSPNENILVNGLVVGKSTSSNVRLISKNGYLIEIIGGSIKKHGVEKLGKIDLKKAIVKTGLLRKNNITPRILNNKNKNNFFKIAFLNHAAENVYEYKDMDLVVTVGDDTTLLASDILYRFNIPIIGITDGDLDKIVEKGFKQKDSIIFKVDEGFDDIIGNRIFEKIFHEKVCIEFPIKNSNSLKSFKQYQIIDIKDKIIEIINIMNHTYIIE